MLLAILLLLVCSFCNTLTSPIHAQQQAYLSIGNKYGKGYREPEVRHAFYAPTKLHYYEQHQYPQFDRAIPSVSWNWAHSKKYSRYASVSAFASLCIGEQTEIGCFLLVDLFLRHSLGVKTVAMMSTALAIFKEFHFWSTLFSRTIDGHHVLFVCPGGRRGARFFLRLSVLELTPPQHATRRGRGRFII